MIADSLDLDKEFYFAIVMDRAYQGPVMVASPQGGMDIEKVAHDSPHLIYKEAVDIVKGVQPEQTRRLAEKLGFKPQNQKQAAEQMARLYELFVKTDAVQVEINPFAETPKGGTCRELRIYVCCIVTHLHTYTRRLQSRRPLTGGSLRRRREGQF